MAVELPSVMSEALPSHSNSIESEIPLISENSRTLQVWSDAHSGHIPCSECESRSFAHGGKLPCMDCKRTQDQRQISRQYFVPCGECESRSFAHIGQLPCMECARALRSALGGRPTGVSPQDPQLEGARALRSQQVGRPTEVVTTQGQRVPEDPQLECARALRSKLVGRPTEVVREDPSFTYGSQLLGLSANMSAVAQPAKEPLQCPPGWSIPQTGKLEPGQQPLFGSSVRRPGSAPDLREYVVDVTRRHKAELAKKSGIITRGELAQRKLLSRVHSPRRQASAPAIRPVTAPAAGGLLVSRRVTSVSRSPSFVRLALILTRCSST